jgi:hypothetical protein
MWCVQACIQRSRAWPGTVWAGRTRPVVEQVSGLVSVWCAACEGGSTGAWEGGGLAVDVQGSGARDVRVL